MINKEVNKIVGAKLRKWRLEKDVSEKVLASTVKISQSTYSRIEHGEIKLSKNIAELLANFYTIDINEIYPTAENYNFENSFHSNSPASGNFNSTIDNADMKPLINNMLQTQQNLSALIQTIADNQQIIIKLLNQ